MRTFLKHYVLNQLITFCKALKVFCIMLLKVDKLEAMLGDLVRSTGIMYNFNLSEGEKKDVDRCFLMLRDMAGYVRDKLSHPEEKESKKNVVKDDDTDTEVGDGDIFWLSGCARLSPNICNIRYI